MDDQGLGAPALPRFAVVDIGSNSIRLVVFEGLLRTPLVLFNEKVLCGLGRKIASTGLLHAEGVAQALDNIVRFRALTLAMRVERVEVLATAAVREASNGLEFTAEIERRTGFRVRVLSGVEEARLSALGMISAIPDADGFLGDLGGGSLELVDVARNRLGEQATLPLGPLRLIDAAQGSTRRARGLVDKALAEVLWLDRLRDRRFYAVGGAWRLFARILMEHQGYPLHIIHQYAVEAGAVTGFIERFRGLSRDELKRIPNISRRRLDTLPWAVLVLERLFIMAAPRELVFSAAGLREGCVYTHLDPAERAADPLLTAAARIAASRRFELGEAELFAFLAPALGPFAPERERLVRAACLISDLGWAEHPDYRAEQAYWRVLRLPIFGVDHAARAFLALAIAARYGGDGGFDPQRTAAGLLPAMSARLAAQIGAALRLGYTLSGGAPGVLSRTQLRLAEPQLVLTLPEDGSVVAGDAVMRRLDTLARLCGATPLLTPANGAEAAAE